MRVGIIGGGSIGASFATLLIAHKVVTPKDVIVIERNVQTCDELSRALGCHAAPVLSETVSDVDIVVLAVKPQEFSSLAISLKNFLKESQVVLSMMTGIRAARLSEELGGHAKIVRCMPNLPFIVGKGMSVCFESEQIAAGDKEKVCGLLNATGISFFVDSEELIDAATALSASGPGFISYLIERFEQSAHELGFTPEQSRLLTNQTFLGTAELLIKKEISPNDAQRRVASRGGTTEAAIKKLEECGVGQSLKEAIRSAYDRAVELGK